MPPKSTQPSNASINDAWNFFRENNFVDALAILEKLPNQSFGTRQLRAKCLQGLNRYAEAVEIYLSISHWNYYQNLMVNLIICYSELRCYSDVVRIYKRITKQKYNADLLFRYAQASEILGDYDEAIKAYNQIENALTDKKIILALIHCCIASDLFSFPETMVKQIPNWEQDRDALLAMAKYYLKIGDYDRAITTYKQIPDWEKTQITLIGLACCYEGNDDNQSAMEYLEKCKTQFPNDAATMYQACRMMAAQDDPRTLATLDEAIEKWTNEPIFLLLKALLLEKSDPEKVLPLLMQIKFKFNLLTEVYLRLIRYYLQRNNLVEANVIQDECLKIFPMDAQLRRQIEKIFSLPKSMLFHNVFHMNNDVLVQTLQVNLPANAKTLLNEFKTKLGGEHFLVGSTLTDLLLNLSYTPSKADLDFESICATAEPLGYQNSCYVPQLYTSRNGFGPVDVFYIPETRDTSPFDLTKTIATVCSCKADASGRAYDMTGYGFRDIQFKTLRIRGNVEKRLAEDPTVMLRVVQFMLRYDFKPTAHLAAVMQQWKKTDNFTTGHVFAVARKHLLTLDGVKYVAALQSFGLLEKLFGICSTNLTDALNKLEKCVGIYRDNFKKLSSYSVIPAVANNNPSRCHKPEQQSPLLSTNAISNKCTSR